MTPERKAWWDSLPTEEKKTRTVLNREKEVIKDSKNDLANEKGYVARKIIRATIKHEKAVITALRKQIGMNERYEITDTDAFYVCPRCGAQSYGTRYCWFCGQKMRRQ